jgi:hypothetical protein
VSCPTSSDCWGVGVTTTYQAVIVSTAPTSESSSHTSGRPGPSRLPSAGPRTQRVSVT